MKEQDERIERLPERYFDARTTEGRRARTARLFRYVDEIPHPPRYARTMFGGLDALAEERYPRRGQRAKPVRLSVRRKGCGVMETALRSWARAQGAENSVPSGAWLAAAVVLGVFLCRISAQALLLYRRCGDLRQGRLPLAQATVYLQGLLGFRRSGPHGG